VRWQTYLSLGGRSVWFGASLTRTACNVLRFLRKLRWRYLHSWVTRLSPRIGVPATVTRRPARAGLKTKCTMPLGYGALLVGRFRATSRMGLGFSTAILIRGKRSSCHSWTWRCSRRGTPAEVTCVLALSGQVRFSKRYATIGHV